MSSNSMYYGSYLQLEKILDSQYPKSFEEGNQPAHDEMLFIVIHQAYELWFKQILFELDYIMSVFGKEKINDNSEDMNLVLHRFGRITRIMDLLNHQVTILDTMTPLDFLEFRNLLTPSSGFQSVQFRLIEARLGLKMDNRHQQAYYKRTNEGGFNPHDYEKINTTEEKPALSTMINSWLERMPFFEADLWKEFNPTYLNKEKLHPFWNEYRSIYLNGLTEREKNKMTDFDYTFFEIIPEGLTEEEKLTLTQLRGQLTPAAMRSALFIMLYRDFPVFQQSFRILDALVEIDTLMSNWRHRHYMMVRRMIGMRLGTGNTSGAGYLQGAMNSHYIFRDIAGLSTYLIERRNLPKLPEALVKKLSFTY